LDRVINQNDSDVIIVVDANGTSRQIMKGISNSEIEKEEKTEFNEIRRILINDDRKLDLAGCQNKVAVIRLRHNDEVPSYYTMEEEKKFNQTSGIFKFKKVYYSIDQKPVHEADAYDKEKSKAVDSSSFSHRNIVEIYPVYVSGDKESHDINEEVAVGIVNVMRNASIQFHGQKTVLPLPLHLAEKMEEYI
jgi:hypothetical protein